MFVFNDRRGRFRIKRKDDNKDRGDGGRIRRIITKDT